MPPDVRVRNRHYRGKPYPPNWDEYSDGDKKTWKEAQDTRRSRLLAILPKLVATARSEQYRPVPIRWSDDFAEGITPEEMGTLLLTARETTAARVSSNAPSPLLSQSELARRTALEKGRPPFLIRAYYGPVKGVERSFILVCPNTAVNRVMRRRKNETAVRGILRQAHDDYGERSWGPREFVWRLLQAGADFSGRVALLMVHSGQYLEFDPVAFRAFCERLEDNPEDINILLKVAVMPGLLLEDSHGSP